MREEILTQEDMKTNGKVLPIVRYPDPILKKVAKEISIANDITISTIKSLANNMVTTLKYSGGGIGLAAPQVGHSVRLIVVKSSLYDKSDTGFIKMVNPTIIEYSDKKYSSSEGCLSFPNVSTNVRRNESLIVKYFDLDNGEWEEKEFKELGSACIQHEIEHLDGILLSDKNGPLKNKFISDFFKKNKKWR